MLTSLIVSFSGQHTSTISYNTKTHATLTCLT